jgi:hypothetical protein
MKKFSSISVLLNASNSDKNTLHKYGIAYDLIFNSQYMKKCEPLKVLEIGVSLFGDGSAKPISKSELVGKYVGIDVDVYHGTGLNDKVTLHTGQAFDGYKRTTLEFLEKEHGKFDIIIDDGPHTWESQEWFLHNYHDLLVDGGVLLCEDINQAFYAHLHQLVDKLNLYVLDLRMNANPHHNEIIAIRYK